MRDPNRIDDFTERLAKAWKRLPDWRFGQLMSNFQRAYGRDIFFPEDDLLIDLMEQYVNQVKNGGQ